MMMTEALVSQQYENGAPRTFYADSDEYLKSPDPRTFYYADSDEYLKSPDTPLSLHSPLVSPLSSPVCTGIVRYKGKGVRLGQEQVDLSVLALLIAALKRTGGLLPCQAIPQGMKMDIGWPTNVRHVAHVTFDRFSGLLGLPVEFEAEVPSRPPSASCKAFGVSAESMQCSHDTRGNSVPTILLLLQERLYEQGGLKTEGIFRINPENSEEEHVRDQLNKGVVPHDINIHCLAGLIKAWFRELPRGVLDTLSPERVMQCHSEVQCLELVSMLPLPQGALLNWAVNLMTDVVQEEQFNKMNARNVAMVFAPNLTQMSDPLTALMHAVQVMNLLKTLISKTLRDRQEVYCVNSGAEGSCAMSKERTQQTDYTTACNSEGTFLRDQETGRTLDEV